MINSNKLCKNILAAHRKLRKKEKEEGNHQCPLLKNGVLLTDPISHTSPHPHPQAPYSSIKRKFLSGKASDLQRIARTGKTSKRRKTSHQMHKVVLRKTKKFRGRSIHP